MSLKGGAASSILATPPFRQLLQPLPVPRDQCFFFGARPFLDLSLGVDRIIDTFKVFRIDQCDRATRRGPCVGEHSIIVLLLAVLRQLSARKPRVVTAVRTSQHVNPSTAHVVGCSTTMCEAHPSRLAIRRAPQGEGFNEVKILSTPSS